ncbi:microsomal signal peptidase 25 kDa subunit [Medicago truncatula]|uniref:Microsomal signal peptidase 25 kDa subunit n=1 Tax=Medicago truncatula TaxID=3880 RepID=G7LE48_MEDTR|nr:microsomal signal peptidase 25 kDa subunit [Medicago truncatula]
MEYFVYSNSHNYRSSGERDSEAEVDSKAECDRGGDGSGGVVEDMKLSNIRLLLGSVIIVIALFAQFYKKFLENCNFLLA